METSDLGSWSDQTAYGHPRMPLAQRAKIFIPFDPLKGFQEALREKEREAEEALDNHEDLIEPA